MRRLVNSPTLARTRGLLGILYIIFGIAIIVRSTPLTAPGLALLGPWVLGLAFVGLGIVRVRAALVTLRR
ncbi:MAG TPA: hypothetical protein VGZ00_03900 [Candidatus Baltobacteraceae bacterium]|jgi:hypothetical protein|nr:hypothetical protein [Candidatus Baltobacteraceae bacterium]